MSFTTASICLAYLNIPNNIKNDIMQYVSLERWCLRRDSNGKLYQVANPAYFVELSKICLAKDSALKPCSVVLNNRTYDETDATSLVQRRRVYDNGYVEITMYISIHHGFSVYRYMDIIYTVSSHDECRFVKGSFYSCDRSLLSVDSFHIENGVLFIKYGYSDMVMGFNRNGPPPRHIHHLIFNPMDTIDPDSIDEYVENDGYELDNFDPEDEGTYCEHSK